ncbi:MAG: tRNA (N6-threonylcarbamoyladenosine(37)-N6)-methyltransferase TrmO [Rhodospirillales bacterium]|nr:MAG: tRNA (N6-threonylcarbamoyladenosine(37)-N6)-methyltransferase TrmO [Rhodospirillales bacterium]
MEAGFSFRPIGRVETPFATTKDCPRNGRALDPAPVCRVHVAPEFAAGLLSVEAFSHLILLYALDRAGPPEMVFTPPFDSAPRGVFATRTPRRPNPVGLSVVALDGRDPDAPDGGGVLRVRYLDCVDGTPLLDIKPYMPRTDSVPDATMGWLARP